MAFLLSEAMVQRIQILESLLAELQVPFRQVAVGKAKEVRALTRMEVDLEQIKVGLLFHPHKPTFTVPMEEQAEVINALHSLAVSRTGDSAVEVEVVTAAEVEVAITEEMVGITPPLVRNTMPAMEGVHLIQEAIKRTKFRVTEIKMVQ
jgi:hypothetical protein